MADQTHDYARHQIDRVYESAEEISRQLRRMADEVDRTIATAKKNEGSTAAFESTFMDLPHNVQHIVHWGIANAGLDQLSRQVREYVSGRDALRQIAATPIVERLEEFIRIWTKNPLNSTKIYSLGYMTGRADARVDAIAQIDTDLLQEIIDLLPKKVS